MLDEELLYKFFLWSMGRDQEVAHTEVGDLDFFSNTVHICPKPHRNYRLKSKRNRNGNVAGFVDSWPSNWLYTQDVFVVEINGVYYLCNPMYPGVNIALSLTL